MPADSYKASRFQGGGDKEKQKPEPEYEHTTPHENQPERSHPGQK